MSELTPQELARLASPMVCRMRTAPPIPSVEYFAHELLSSVYENTDVQQANRVLCGFAMLTLGPDSINEQFIDQTEEVRWSKTTAL